jgi:hypothetical protein
MTPSEHSDDFLHNFDPVAVLIGEAIEVLSEYDPSWNDCTRERKRDMLDGLKARTLRRVNTGKYFLFSMIVRKRVLLCPAPFGTKANITYNPFR